MDNRMQARIMVILHRAAGRALGMLSYNPNHSLNVPLSILWLSAKPNPRFINRANSSVGSHMGKSVPNMQFSTP